MHFTQTNSNFKTYELTNVKGTWTSGYGQIRAIEHIAFVTVGLIGVTLNANEGIFDVSTEITPTAWTTPIAFYRNDGKMEPFVTAFMNGKLVTTIPLTDAYIVFNSAWFF